MGQLFQMTEAKQERNRKAREAYAKDGERVRAYNRAYRQAHNGAVLVADAARRTRAAVEIAATRKRWKSRNRAKVLADTRKRQAQKLLAVPAWADDEWDNFLTSEMYELAVLRTTLTGEGWHVDHVVPLQAPAVCGLHCAANLRVIPAKHNFIKGNRWWPDMPTGGSHGGD